MKVIVVRDYRDKHTKILNKAGTELIVTVERFAEINGTSLGIFVKEIATEPKESQKKPKKSR